LEYIKTAFQQIKSGQTIKLPPKTSSFKLRNEKLYSYVRSTELHQELDYWLAIPWTQIPSLPVDYPESKEKATRISYRSVELSLTPAETNLLLDSVSRVYGAELKDALLMALVKALTNWSGGQWAKITMVNSGRFIVPGTENLDLTRTVGLITLNTLSLLKKEEVNDHGEFLQSIRKQLKRIPNEGIGYFLLRYLSENSEIAEKLKMDEDVYFNYMNWQAIQSNDETSQFQSALESIGTGDEPQEKRPRLIYCILNFIDGALISSWQYSENVHKRSTIEKVAQDFVETLRALSHSNPLQKIKHYIPAKE
jgi:non-ribosomal peptide synthase protein (TIGR01720 family)